MQAPELVTSLYNRWREAWLGSPAAMDLDGDGVTEIVVPRADRVMVWHLDGELLHELETEGRVWSSPVVADVAPEREGLEIVVASRGRVYAWDAHGEALAGFPVEWRDELRSVAVEDIDGDERLEIVAVTTNKLEADGQADIIVAFESDGTIAAGFPPNTTGASGCDDACYVHGGFDQNLALGDLDGDGVADIVAPHDNAYISVHDGSGVAFDAHGGFDGRTKMLGVRFLHEYDLARQGWAEDEQSANQAHFTNTPPAIADVDSDGDAEIVMVGSVQNAAQSDRERGVALWVINPDGTRPSAWSEPYHAPDFIDGLWDLGDNIVGATNQVSVADLDGSRDGPELVFAGFDGRIHAVDSRAQQLWQTPYTTSAGVLTGGVAIADLSGDGRAEIVFNSYSSHADAGGLFVMSAAGEILHELPLPGRGAMPVPTVVDVDDDGQLEILVSLKDAIDGEEQVRVYTVPGSSDNCRPWPTGRANFRRSGWVTR